MTLYPTQFAAQLKLGPIHQFPYVGVFFTVNVSLVNEVNTEGIGKFIPFKLALYAGESADQLAPVENGIEVDKNSKLEITRATSVPVNIKILQPSGVSLFNPRKFFLRVEPSAPEHAHIIKGGYSDPLVAVNCRLVITNGHELPPIYYNATKGKRNKMELRVKLLDSAGNPVLDRPNLKLNFVLHYEDNKTVCQAEKKLLDISSDSKLYIGEEGEAVIYFRIINCVSRKHDNKKFKVSVSADSTHNAARYNDVSFDYSPCIDVRTKVDTKARERRMKEKGKQIPPEEGVALKSALKSDEKSNDGSLGPLLKMPKTLSFMENYSVGPSLSATVSQPSNLTLPSNFSFSDMFSGTFSFPPTSIATTPAVSAWVQDVVAKLKTIRWTEVEGNTDNHDQCPKKRGIDVVTGVCEGYNIRNPNAVIDEIIESSERILHMSTSTEADFAVKCAKVEDVGPLAARSHSLYSESVPLSR